jgi:hypothetical protein
MDTLTEQEESNNVLFFKHTAIHIVLGMAVIGAIYIFDWMFGRSINSSVVLWVLGAEFLTYWFRATGEDFGALRVRTQQLNDKVFEMDHKIDKVLEQLETLNR